MKTRRTSFLYIVEIEMKSTFNRFRYNDKIKYKIIILLLIPALYSTNFLIIAYRNIICKFFFEVCFFIAVFLLNLSLINAPMRIHHVLISANLLCIIIYSFSIVFWS